MPLLHALDLAIHTDEAIGRLVTPEILTMPAVNLDGTRIVAPGRARLLEDLWLARRTHAALGLLMIHTSTSTTPAGDLTESAAILGRRLIEILGQVVWLIDYQAPEGLKFPVDLGDPDDLAKSALDAPWSAGDRRAFCAYLCSAVDWIDIQALRSDREDLESRRKLSNAILDVSSGTDVVARTEQTKTIAAQDDLTVKRLTGIGAPTTARYDLVTLLSKINKSAVLAYRYESDAAHAGSVGRLLQRGTGEDPDLGARAPDWRRLMVLQLANINMLSIAKRALGFLGADVTSLDALADEHEESLAREAE